MNEVMIAPTIIPNTNVITNPRTPLHLWQCKNMRYAIAPLRAAFVIANPGFVWMYDKFATALTTNIKDHNKHNLLGF